MRAQTCEYSDLIAVLILVFQSSSGVLAGRVHLETDSGNVVSTGKKIHVQWGGTPEGDVVSTGGTVEIAGRVRGDVVAIAGCPLLQETAVALSGGFERKDGAVVRGKAISIGMELVPDLRLHMREVINDCVHV